MIAGRQFMSNIEGQEISAGYLQTRSASLLYVLKSFFTLSLALFLICF